MSAWWLVSSIILWTYAARPGAHWPVPALGPRAGADVFLWAADRLLKGDERCADARPFSPKTGYSILCFSPELPAATAAQSATSTGRESKYGSAVAPDT